MLALKVEGKMRAGTLPHANLITPYVVGKQGSIEAVNHVMRLVDFAGWEAFCLNSGDVVARLYNTHGVFLWRRVALVDFVGLVREVRH